MNLISSRTVVILEFGQAFVISLRPFPVAGFASAIGALSPLQFGLFSAVRAGKVVGMSGIFLSRTSESNRIRVFAAKEDAIFSHTFR